MRYALHDLDLAEPLPTVTLSEEERGLAVVARWKRRPVGFWMEALPPGSTIAPDALGRRLSEHVGAGLVRERLREALPAPDDAPPFPTLTVAICTKDRAPLLERCLASLGQLDAPAPLGGSGLDVVVVDNAPCDGQTREAVGRWPGVRYVCEPKPGLNFARNRALREARGELLAYLDDDVVVDAGWLAGLREAWAAHPDAGGFTGLVLPYALETEAQILFERRGGFRKGFEQRRFGATQPGHALYPAGAGVFGTGANMAFRRGLLEQLGGFDEALDTGGPLPGGGDLDIFYRVVRAGRALVYEPTFLVFHEHRREVEALRRQYADSWGTGLMAFVAKSYQADPERRAQQRRFVGQWLGRQAMRLQRSLRRGDAREARMVWGEISGGLRGLAGGYGRSARRIERVRRQHAAALAEDARAEAPR